MSATDGLKVFVWNRSYVLPDSDGDIFMGGSSTDGIAVAIATTQEEAIKLVIQEASKPNANWGANERDVKMLESQLHDIAPATFDVVPQAYFADGGLF